MRNAEFDDTDNIIPKHGHEKYLFSAGPDWQEGVSGGFRLSKAVDTERNSENICHIQIIVQKRKFKIIILAILSIGNNLNI